MISMHLCSYVFCLGLGINWIWIIGVQSCFLGCPLVDVIRILAGLGSNYGRVHLREVLQSLIPCLGLSAIDFSAGSCSYGRACLSKVLHRLITPTFLPKKERLLQSPKWYLLNLDLVWINSDEEKLVPHVAIQSTRTSQGVISQ